jgi:Putative F0F1-ATPase subunit Ca2+/Mg2+ transporter
MTLTEHDPEDFGSPSSPQRSSDPKSGHSRGFPVRLLGSGMELASYTLILGAAGYWVDGRWQHTQPYLGIAGALVGFSLGMYRLIVLASRQS